MKTKTLTVLLMLLAAASGTSARPKTPKLKPSSDTTYVAKTQLPNAGYFLPAPPDTASMDFVDDMIQWQWGKSQRPTPRGQKANEESLWMPSIMQRVMSQALGIDTISPEATPALARLLLRAYNTGNRSTAAVKALYMRTRPFAQMGEDTWAEYDTDFLRTNGSYPSGHTSLGWGTALAFAEMWPELQDTILRRGFEFGENRIITGAHYQSDVNAGYLCAAASMARAHLHPEYRQDIQEAREEYIRLKGLPVGYDPVAHAGLPRGERILNAPVDTASYRYEGDLFRHWKAKSLRPTHRGRQAARNADLSLEYLMDIFGKAIDLPLSKDATPALAELFSAVYTQSRAAAKFLKNVYFRKRPYVQLDEPTAVPAWEERSRTSSSYASGHANLAWSLALVLAEVVPECQDEVLRIGYDYGYDRVIVGYHWASDVEAGRLLGCAVVARMHADKAFCELIAKARNEYQASKQAP